MSASISVLGVAVLLLHLWGTHSFPTSACPVPCLCQRGPLLNCSSLDLTEIPTRIPPTAVSLNISNNALRSLAPLSFGHVKLKGLLHLWVGSNALESLSLILKKDRSGTRTLSSGGQECMSWAPDLQLLSAERNHLKHLPKGLGCINSLQILQLSYNQISKIGLTDLDNCIHLKELHLQHNSIISIHPQAFIDLKQLQVLDLSYNLLVTIPVPTYQSLRNLNALVSVSFNRWTCDCNLQTLRRWISFDTEMGDASWQVVCASPPHHAGKDLLHLKDSELTCPTHESSTSGHYHNMIVDEGMQISISCSNDSQDIMQVHWWTPHGQVRDNQPKLLIKDITEQQAGLYVCISGLRGEHISVFDLHVYKKGSGARPRREAATILDEEENKNTPRNEPVVRQTRSQTDFVLAVCLSVIITFIVAFILGVLLRPLLDKLWRRIRSKRQSTPPPPPTTTSSTGPQPYVNEGYCDVEDQEREVRVGSRVTFGGITEVEDQVPYYVTVENDQADGSSESNTEVEALYETIEKDKSSITGGKQQALEMEIHRGRADSSSSSSLQEGEVNALVINGKKLPTCSTEDTEFEPIPDADDIKQLKRRGSSSTSSQSSQEGNFSKQTEQSVDPPAVTIPANKNTTGSIPGFSTEPFSEWSNRLTEQNVDHLDPELWNDSGESFSFTDGSERSSIRDLSSSALGHPLKDDDTWRQSKVGSPSDKINLDSKVLDFDKPFGKELPVDDVKQFELSDIENSSNSSESEGGPNNYVVNPELMDESDTENYANLVTLNRYEDVTLNERMPSAGILIRQENITLEPSDIHLTLTHEDGVDESMHIYDSPRKSEDDKFGICVDVGLDTVPKVKRYVEFKQFKPHFGPPTLPSFSPTSTKKNNTLSDIEVKSEANTDAFSGDNKCLTQIEVSPDRIQKVKRYIHFKQAEPHSPTLSSSPSFTKKDDMLEAKSYSSSSDDDAELTTKGDNFDVSSDGVSKVKRYILFKQIESSSPTLSVSRPKLETTTEETIKSLQPSTTSKDTSQNVKKYVYINQNKQHSSSLPSSPTSTMKGLSGKKSKHKKQDQSYYGSHDSLPLYHVHPVYRSSINRLNRGYDTDRSSSSEDDDQFLEYPTKLQITEAPGMNRGPITPDKNTNKFLNIDFDNSSSSTDVFDKKQPKGLMRLRVLSARLFKRHEHEPDEGNLQSQIQTKSKTKVTTYEDSLFGKGLSLAHLPKVKRYLQFTHSDSYPQVQLPSPPPTTGVVMPEFIVTTESRRSSFSSEDDVKQTTEDKNFVGQVDASYDGLPKVKRYIQFSSTEPCSTTLPLNKQSISPELVAQPESRRSSTSSDDDDIKLTTNEDCFFRKIGVSVDTMPNVKRYIQFSQPKPYSPTLTSSPISTKRPEAVVETSSSTSVMLDDKSDATENNFWGQINLDAVSKVKRYVQFTQSKHHSPTVPSVSSSTKVTIDMAVKPEATTDRSSGDQGYLTQIQVSPENIQKVKRYIHFKQSEPHSPTLPSPPSLTMKDAIQETRRYSSSSDDDQLTTKEDNFFRKIGVSSDGVSKVKRFITFKQSEPSSPTLSISSPTATTEAVKSMLTSTSKDDVRSQNDRDNFFAKTDVSFDGVPKVKQYLKFKETELPPQHIQSTSSSSTSGVVKQGKVETEFFGEMGISLDRIPQVKRYIQFKQPVSHLPIVSPTTSDTLQVTTEVKTKSEAKRSSTSSEDDVKQTADVSGQTGTSLDRVPRVKRYIQFTHPEIQSQAQTTERVNVTIVAKETRRWSTSSEEDVKPTTKKENITEETSEYLAKIPKVKRYIKFTQSEPYSSNLSQFRPLTMEKSRKGTETELKQPATRESTSSEDDVQEDDGFGKIGVSLNGVPQVKRYIQFTHPESQSPAQSTSAVSAQRLGILGVVQDTGRSSTSSEEDVTLTAKEDNVFGHTGASLDKIPKIKRYIQFTKHESEPLVQTTTALSVNRLGISGVVQETRKSSTSSDDDAFKQRGESFDKIPKVKRYIKFTQSEPSQVLAPYLLPSTVKSVKVTETGSSTLISPKENVKEDSVVGQTEAHLDRISRVKRYIQFTHRSPEQSTTSLPAERVGISEVILETRRSSTSSEDDVTSKEDYFGGHTGAHLDKIPKVKRYIHFAHPESQSSAQTTTSLSAERVNVSVEAKETKRPSSSSEDDKPSTNDGNIIGETGEFLDKIPKVKRYIEFTQCEPYSSAQSKLPSSGVAKSIKMIATELRGSSTSVEDYVQPSTNENKKASQTQITSSENLPRVKRYIQFTPIESQYPARASTAVLAERVGISRVGQETKISSTSAVKPSANIIGKTDRNFFQETGVSLDNFPKVKRYIAFTKSEPSSSTKLMKRDLTPTTNTYFETTWSSLSSEVSPPASMKKGSALIIKTQSESRTSEFTSKDNIMKGQLMGSSVGQTGLKSKLKKSRSSSSDEHSVGHEVVDVDVLAPQDEPPAVPQTSPPPLEQEESREYLRENSEIRQRQERRRIQQQRRREMDEFNIASLPSIQQGGEQQDRSPADYGEITEHTYSSVSTRNTLTSSHAEGAEVPVLQGLKTKSTSTLGSKSTPKYREYLI
ncbi:uncharacterized protein LOC131526838 isoform X2 [Onychostoma macrolepis]|uniref:Ig-like domain-containing protein n=2 Tax=Onychostoma macrolepis TaxID=369639 RepID=A0A7J6BWT3_9TELE|nr:uncharacterized protein LOC131526838 isoform X2 [Onychostoma macrolepis]KAF4099446.1 hypothetical protein G5714_019572 [Onychostoma macrolepis]